MMFIKIKSYILRLLVLLITATLAVACTTNTPEQPDFPPLRIGANAWVGYGAVHIAEAQGFFDEEGVEVDIIPYDNYDQATADFASKQLDANMTAFSDVIAQNAAGVAGQVIYVLDFSDGGDVLVGNGEFTEVEELRGKRIGLSYGTFSHVFVLNGLANAGLTQDDITIVSMNEADVPGALADGTIDAGHTWEPFLSDAINNGGSIIFTSQDTPGIVADLITVHASVIEERPDDIAALVRAIVRATDFWEENPQTGNAIVAEAVGEEEDVVAIIASEELNILGLEENLLAFDATNDSPLTLHISGQFAIDVFDSNNIIDRIPDLDSIINPAFVEQLANR